LIRNHFKIRSIYKRYGPVLLFEIKNNKNKAELKKLFMFRHKITNFKKNISKQYLLFPLHFKITDKIFNDNLKNILNFKSNLKIY